MPLCPRCDLQDFCAWMQPRKIIEKEFSNSLAHDVLAYARNMNLTPDEWPHFLEYANLYYRGRIMNQEGREVGVDLDWLLDDNIKYWFRYRVCQYDPTRPLRIRKESEQRVMDIATLLRALDPLRGNLWGKVANDNEPPLFPCEPHRDCGFPSSLYRPGGLCLPAIERFHRSRRRA